MPSNLQLRMTATGPKCAEAPASKRRQPCSVPWYQIKVQGADAICRARKLVRVSERLLGSMSSAVL